VNVTGGGADVCANPAASKAHTQMKYTDDKNALEERSTRTLRQAGILNRD